MNHQGTKARSGKAVSDELIKTVKGYRQELDGVLQRVKWAQPMSRERALAITKIQEAIMWLGMELKRYNEGRSCYADGYDAESANVEPTADGLKL